MYQTEFKFFWTLTEQPELDLDYSECDRPKLTWPSINNIGATGASPYFLQSNGNENTWVSVSASKLQIDTETTVFRTKEEPPFYRRWLLNLLGIRWEKKT